MSEARDSAGWLGNVDYTDFGAIEADINAMEQFAAKLKQDIELNYAPYADAVSTTMIKQLPDTPFYELHLFLYRHDQVQIATQMNVAGYTDGTYKFASAASGISEQYRGSDAFSRAKVADVEAQFESTGETSEPFPGGA
ncbi:hypothetical protein Aca07nite_07980 [Actinoplanes capillaceus]|uniref:Uncharacterized protein n=1 Tax=Actinoplanes campanulatus TaxID=113559 RepID=A0ABQ3WBH7_9ACTN|nr:hypothetical protein GCM10010109_29010 [Actinoplanes campanulatus]GID37575.1 hypothetical protein Aca09nite_40810 [Actinoplanes campanulatus]GID43523.1 hypothetical protein Aca07nite_07980 [Actinoplanes capillaceus]